MIDKDALLDVVALWLATFGTTPTLVADIAVAPMLQAKLFQLQRFALKTTFNPRAVGWWLRRHKGIVVGGYSFQCKNMGNRMRWWLARVEN